MDVFLGNVDLCIGPFWNLENKPGLYTVTLFNDPFFIFARKQAVEEWRNTLVQPFDSESWIAIAATLFTMIFVLKVVLAQILEKSRKRWVYESHLKFDGFIAVLKKLSATVYNAIYAAGGINENATLRDIKVFRNNKIISNVDIYEYLKYGKNTSKKPPTNRSKNM